MPDAAANLVTISVHGSATRIVEADEASLSITVAGSTESQSAARVVVQHELSQLLDELAGLGGTTFTPATVQSALTWSRAALHTWPEQDDRGQPTGRYHSEAVVDIRVRDFGLLPAVETALTRRDAVRIGDVGWSVDDDNAAWPLVRASAIEAALGRARDYASALGGRIVAVEHVADRGLLSDSDQSREQALSFRAAAYSNSPGSSLDPVPQQLHATVDARLRAAVTASPPDSGHGTTGTPET